MNVNKVFILGNLTRDPEVRATASGAAVANLGVATNRFWMNQNRERQKEVEYHNVVLFGKNAEIAREYLSKGKTVFIEGRLKTRDWQDKEGVKKFRTEVIAERIQLGPKGFDNQSSSSANANANVNLNTNANNNQKAVSGQNDLDIIEYPEEDISPDDIPF